MASTSPRSRWPAAAGGGRPPPARRVGPPGQVSGRLYVGTSGFGYPSWAPRFYPAGARGEALLRFYASKLPACELNGTFYRQPSVAIARGWAAATPPGFRFIVKALRGGAMRALGADPDGTLPWLLEPDSTLAEARR